MLKTVLLGAQQVDWHRPGVVGAQQLLALLGELGEATALPGSLGFRLLAHPGERGAELAPHRLDPVDGQANVAVGALDRRLDQVDWHVGLFAAGSPSSALGNKK